MLGLHSCIAKATDETRRSTLPGSERQQSKYKADMRVCQDPGQRSLGVQTRPCDPYLSGVSWHLCAAVLLALWEGRLDHTA